MERRAHQAFMTLRFGFTVAPIIAGLDKFLEILTHWEKYLAPAIPNALHMQPNTFMVIVGAIEIVAGLMVAIQPRIGAWVVAAWLVARAVGTGLAVWPCPKGTLDPSNGGGFDLLCSIQ